MAAGPPMISFISPIRMEETQPSECDDVIRRAAVSMTGRQQGAVPGRSLLGSEYPVSVLEQNIGC